MKNFLVKCCADKDSTDEKPLSLGIEPSLRAGKLIKQIENRFHSVGVRVKQTWK